ncbi:hypothetical protein GOP47_0025348 [Adiantum capillus-veneris]|uniref:Uncharacterized protein n=1 Tax=Adiantum capillus-veneris TaxID=13818 RepID=A0A9D4U0A2_ADICA|nr:hypothetical protein GOP47_0025348 [Adiantum capillus-veneris]
MKALSAGKEWKRERLEGYKTQRKCKNRLGARTGPGFGHRKAGLNFGLGPNGVAARPDEQAVAVHVELFSTPKPRTNIREIVSRCARVQL